MIFNAVADTQAFIIKQKVWHYFNDFVVLAFQSDQ